MRGKPIRLTKGNKRNEEKRKRILSKRRKEKPREVSKPIVVQKVEKVVRNVRKVAEVVQKVAKDVGKSIAKMSGFLQAAWGKFRSKRRNGRCG